MEKENRAVLCVDDELSILSSLKRLLRKEDYTLFTANSAKEGLEILEQHDIQVVLSDQRMPEITGVAFLQQVKRMYPSTVRVVLSGYADVATIVDAINKGEVYRFLTKPWNDENLKLDIKQCFDQYEIIKEKQKMNDVIRGQNEKLQEMNEQLKGMNERLEQQVIDRTRSLQMSQDILIKLPQPVLGVSSDCRIIMVNEAASNRFSELAHFFQGTFIDDLIPEPMCMLIRKSIENNVVNEGKLTWGDDMISFKIQPLISDNNVRGTIVTIL